jgi:hypothetical protein
VTRSWAASTAALLMRRVAVRARRISWTISRNFYAQADDGTVCYFGEDVDTYDEAGERRVA